MQPHLDRVSLRFRMRLQSANRQIDNVYFPESGIVSVVAVSATDRHKAEVALVGREGMTGLPTVLGVAHSPYDLFVQIAGEGQRISTHKLLEVMDQSTTLGSVFFATLTSSQRSAATRPWRMRTAVLKKDLRGGCS